MLKEIEDNANDLIHSTWAKLNLGEPLNKLEIITAQLYGWINAKGEKVWQS